MVGILGHVSTVSSETTDSWARIPQEFIRQVAIMSQKAVDALLSYKEYVCKIEIKEGEKAPSRPIYPLSEQELETLREWLKEMLRTGKIQRSTSSAGSPILFVPKPSRRGLRLCIDYRALNCITIPNRYPLPLMQELQDRVQGAEWFTKLDLKNGFNLIRIRNGDRVIFGLKIIV